MDAIAPRTETVPDAASAESAGHMKLPSDFVRSRLRLVPQHCGLNGSSMRCFVPRQARDRLERTGFTAFTFQSPVLHQSDEPVADWFQMQACDDSRPVVDKAML